MTPATIELPRRIEALQELFAFTARTWRREGLAEGLLPRVDLVLEELFTNVVKYGKGSAPLQLGIRADGAGIEVTLGDPEASYFDPTRAPPVDTGAPIEQRRPGGLGLHLIRQLVDSLDYRYSDESRSSCVTFRIGGVRGGPGAGGNEKEDDA